MMDGIERAPVGPAPDRPTYRPQFSVRTLFLVPLVFACVLSVIVVARSTVDMVVILSLSVAFPAVLTMGVIYSKRSVRAFCIGALFPSGVLLYATAWLFTQLILDFGRHSLGVQMRTAADWDKYFRPFVETYGNFAYSAWVLSFLVGLACVGVRWSIVGRAGSRQRGPGRSERS